MLLEADIELKSLSRSCECLDCADDAGFVGGRRFCEIPLIVSKVEGFSNASLVSMSYRLAGVEDPIGDLYLD